MRKLLLSLACAVAVSASAQKIQVDRTATEVKLSEEQPALLAGKAIEKAPKKGALEGVYYKTPAGSLWMLNEKPLYTYNSPLLVVAPWTDFTLTNMGTTKKGDWTIVVTASTTIDKNEDADEDNNLIMSYTGGAGGYYGVTYTEGEVSYIPTSKGGSTCINYVNAVEFHSFFPTSVGEPKLYGGGSLSNGNLYGGGTLSVDINGDGEAETGVSLGVLYCTPKPMSPLYVDSISVWAIQRDTELDPMGGKTLYINIYNRESDSNEPTVQLTMTPDELRYSRASGTFDLYLATFRQKVIDEVSGEEVAAPFVIDYPAEIHILGFNQEGVNIGLMGTDTQDEFLSEDVDENQGYFPVLFEDGTIKNYRYSNTVPILGFWSMFDHCEVMTAAMSSSGELRENVNGIKVSNDGQECGNVVFSNIEGVEVYTALDWEDEESGEEMYWSDDQYDYDWIQNLTCSEVLYSNSENAIGGCYYIGAVCDELPDGVEGRYAVIHLNGRGVTSEPIFILQGNITMEEAMTADAIKNVNANSPVANGKTYNMMGQEVSKNAKGLVIRNGQKMLVK